MRHDGREQRGGLALDRALVALFGARDVEEVLQLEDLAAAQLADGGGEQRGDVGAERRGERRRPGEQEVAGEDRHDVVPAGVHARHAPPGLGLVDDVVVVERPEVHELDRHRAGDRVVAARPRLAALQVDAYAAQRVKVGRIRLPPAPIRCAATSPRNGSEVRTGVAERRFDPDEVDGERGELHGSGRRRRTSRPCHAATVRSQGTFSKPEVLNTRTRNRVRRSASSRTGADYTATMALAPVCESEQHVLGAQTWGGRRIRLTRGGPIPCSNASPIEPAEWSSWRRKKRACSTTTTSGPSTSCSA